MDAFALDVVSGPRLYFMLSLTFRHSIESPSWFVLLPNLRTTNFTFSSFYQVLDGYFVHYFAPKDLPPLPKNVVFVLDSSASMVGTKLRQVSPCHSFLFHVCPGQWCSQWMGFNWCKMSASPFICSCLWEHSWTLSEAADMNCHLGMGVLGEQRAAETPWNKGNWGIMWARWEKPLNSTIVGGIILFSDGVPWPMFRTKDLYLNNSGLPGSLAGKESPCNAGDPGSIPGLGRSLGEGIGYPLQYSWAFLVT